MLHVILYIPLFLCSDVCIWFMGLMSCCNVVVALNTIPMLVFFKQICNSSYFWGVVGERGPNFIMFLPVMCVIAFVLYLLVKFLK